MSVKGTLNLELSLTVKNLEELVEKTSTIARILKAEGLEHKLDFGETKVVRDTSHGARGRPLTQLSSELVGYFSGLGEAEAITFTANVIAFDDTFRSEETDPIWGLAFTSRDITEGKNLGAYLRKKQKVRMTIRKIKEGEL